MVKTAIKVSKSFEGNIPGILDSLKAQFHIRLYCPQQFLMPVLHADRTSNQNIKFYKASIFPVWWKKLRTFCCNREYRDRSLCGVKYVRAGNKDGYLREGASDFYFFCTSETLYLYQVKPKNETQNFVKIKKKCLLLTNSNE